MPEESGPSKEKKMAQDLHRGQRSQEWEDDRRQSVPCRTSAGAGSEREAPRAGTRDRRTRKPEVQMYVPRPMRNRLKKQEDAVAPSVTCSAETSQSERARQSSEVKDKKSRQPSKGIEEFEKPTEKLVRQEKVHKSHRESVPTGSKKHRSAKEHRQGNDRGACKKDDGLRQKGTKEKAHLEPTSHRSDRQVNGKERENIKKKTLEIVMATEGGPIAVASDETETLQSAKDLSLVQVLESKETPEKVAKVSNVQDDVHSIFLPRPLSDREELQVNEDSETVGQEGVTGYTKCAEGVTSTIVPDIECSSQSSSSVDIHNKASSGFTEVDMSVQVNSGKTELCNEVSKFTETPTINMSSNENTEYVDDQSRVTIHSDEIDNVLTVTKGIDAELEAGQTLTVTSTHETHLAGDKTPNVVDIPCDTRNAASSTEVVDMTVVSETLNPEDIASSLKTGECIVLTDKQNSEQTKETNSPEQTTLKNSSCLRNSSNENDDEDNSEQFWDAEMDLQGRDLGKEDDVITEEQEDGQLGVASDVDAGEDSWDAMFDDDGECLNPDQMEELLEGVEMVKVTTVKPKHDYWNWKPKDIQLEEGYEHVVELSDFPAEFKTPDLVSALAEFQSQGFNIKWVDDTHALAVFSTRAVAMKALQIKNPLLRVKPMSEATQQSKKKVKNCAEFLQPFKPRPAASAMVARRLVSGALGVRANIPKEKREEERRKLKEAKEQKRLEKEQRESAWEGR
ncbi:R3HCC1L [Branchiostoma lanceolatum]|uniref:R3HCC1L protein n=2 Tax=Branchiostoma lanceolatum TaxID=7740 RepID=A0A8K0EPG2_BRALA|nr:R3HCC1L [Branchiostoma lanceolatum]